MKNLAPEAFEVKDGEVITIEANSTGATTLFGVNFSIFGGGSPLKEGESQKITMDQSKAQGKSTVSHAKSTPMTLLFSFTSSSGGKYDLTMTGSDGGTFADSTNQAGKAPKAITYTFHIVKDPEEGSEENHV